MRYALLEIVGLFLAVVGAGTIVAAASLVSLALAVLAAGVLLVLAGVVAVTLAVGLEKAAAAAESRAARPAGDGT